MQETYSDLWRALQLYSPVLPTTLAQQFIKSRFRDIRRKRLWSWRIGRNQFISPAAYSVGTVNATVGSPTITGNGTAWTSNLVGLQFRVGNIAPIYTIVSVDSATQITLDLPYGGVGNVNAVGYQIFQAYLTPPADFQDFISVADVFNNYRLTLHLSQQFLDTYDSQRSWTGNPYGIADFRYSSAPTSGSVGAVVQAVGTSGDAAPFAFGTYTGRTKSIFIITVTTGGAVGTAVYSWSKDNGTVNAGIVSQQAAFLLQEGVNLQWPSNVGNFIQGDVFVVSATPGLSTSLPQYELWPYSMAQRVYPFIYDKRFPDLDDSNGIIPPYIDADVIVKGALSDVCRWKGTESRENPMYGVDIAASFEKEFQTKVAEMEREDDEVYLVDVEYDLYSAYPFAPFPFMMGANWAQSHAVSA